MTAPDLHQLIDRLITAAIKAGQEIERGHGLTSNIPVEEAKRRLYTRLEQHGLDGTGWIPEPVSREEYAELERERDRALGEVERLNGVILDLHERCNMERERADAATASNVIYVSRLGDTA